MINGCCKYNSAKRACAVLFLYFSPKEAADQKSVVLGSSAEKLTGYFNTPVLLLYRPDGGHSTTYDDVRTAAEFVFDALEKAETPSNDAK